MAYENLGESLLNYDPCRYGKSKLLFRGPRRRLKGEYVAFLGGTETYGKFIERPFPMLIEENTGTKAINFGCVNAGVDVYSEDNTIVEACRGAKATVIQVMGAQNMSNQYYAVHPRRNDRFVRATTLLREIYKDVDFTDFNFNRHMLTHLLRRSPERFDKVRQELKSAWVARMRLLLDKIGGTIVLLHLFHQPGGRTIVRDKPHLGPEPLFVDADMIRDLGDRVSVNVEINLPRANGDVATQGMVFSEMETMAAEKLPGVSVHRDIADSLASVLRDAK